MKINGATRIVGIFGSPITHTASPAMHNAAFDALQMNWVYLPFCVQPKNLRNALFGARDLGMVGVNLTVPHKILACEIVDEIHSETRKLGAVNTVISQHDRLLGFNTDGYGIIKALEEEFQFSPKGKSILVLGAGGAGRAIAVKCALEGAAKIIVSNRTLSKIEPIENEVKHTTSHFEGIEMTNGAIARVVNQVDLVINATSVGLTTKEMLPLDPELFSPRLFVYDTIYSPSQTALLKVAASRGSKVANGLSMLLHQGAKSFSLWTKCDPPIDRMRAALRQAIYRETV